MGFKSPGHILGFKSSDFSHCLELSLLAIRWYHRRSEWSQDHNGCYFSSWNDLTVKKSASKSSAVSAQEGGILYWPAIWVAYKRRPGRPQSPVCSQWSTPPHPSWTQPELHHLDTVCWISRFSIVDKRNFPWARPDQQGRAHFHQSGKLGRAPFKWACPSQVSAPLSIYQANLSAPLSINQANLSAPSQKGALFPILQTASQKNLEWMEEWPNRNQLAETERGLTHFSSARLLPV